jgi:hypothetical protein
MPKDRSVGTQLRGWVGPSIGMGDTQIKSIYCPPEPHIAIRLIGRATHSQCAKHTSNPAPPKRCVLFRMQDVISNSVPPKRCSVSYARRNLELDTSETGGTRWRSG